MANTTENRDLPALTSSKRSLNWTCTFLIFCGGMLLLPGSVALAFVSVRLMLCAIFIGIVMIAAGTELAIRNPS